MAGGTGGHVYPALSVALELRRRGHDVCWLGAAGPEQKVAARWGIPLLRLPVRGLRGGGLRALSMWPLFAWAVWRAVWWLRRRRPAVALGMGGYASVPGALAARLLRIPLCVHEQNSVPGLANRWLSRYAVCVLQAFPGAFPERLEPRTVGNPLRPELTGLPSPGQRRAARAAAAPLRLLVLGGSQGAHALNELMPKLLRGLAGRPSLEVWHQAGAGRGAATREAYHDACAQVRVDDYLENIAEAYLWADLVVCRAGALTLSELCAVGLAAILVPLPGAADDHQARNAACLARGGAALTLPQEELALRLPDELRRLERDRESLWRMAAAGKQLARPRAAEQVVDHCLREARI